LVERLFVLSARSSLVEVEAGIGHQRRAQLRVLQDSWGASPGLDGATVTKLLFTAAQIWLPITGLPTIYFTSKKSKFAPLFGLLGQPAWFYCTIYTKQWGMFALNVAYAAMWVLTAYRWWSLPKSPQIVSEAPRTTL
jgi:hypothetical protein